MLNDFLLAFIPIFVAIDPVGVLPIFMGLTEGLTQEKRRKIIFQSLITATCVAISFIFLGKIVFQILGITMGDFMIAGGAILFCISVLDLIQVDKARGTAGEDLGAVPIGTPIMVGPGALTTMLIMIDLHGIPATLMAVLINIVLVGIIFLNSLKINKILGNSGSRALSKVMSLVLAAFAVMMIRHGVLQILGK